MIAGRRTTGSFVLLIAAAIFVAAQKNTPPIPEPQPVETWKKSSVPVELAHSDPSTNEIREVRGSLFNDRTHSRRALDSPTPNDHTSHGTFPPYYVRIPAIPVAESDTVVEGTLGAFQPYFSSDHTGLYTELTIQVGETFKDTTRKAGKGRTITVVLAGGNLLMPDGKVISDSFVPSNFRLEKDYKYVIFLRYFPGGDFFQVIKTWELQQSRVIPTAHEDIVDATDGRSKHASLSSEDFVKAVSDAAATNRDQ